MRIIRTLKSIQETTSREIYVDETITRGMILGDLIEETKTYLFNIDGDLVETKTSNIFSYFLPSRIMNSGPRFLYFYNKAGKLERKLKVDDDKVTESMIIIYDDFENKIDESYYNEKNELNKRNIYKYDNQGNCIQKDEYYSEVLFMKKFQRTS